MIVYDPENNKHDKPSVDARECVETLGWSYEPKPAPMIVTVEGDEPVEVEVLKNGEEEEQTKTMLIKRKRAKAE